MTPTFFFPKSLSISTAFMLLTLSAIDVQAQSGSETPCNTLAPSDEATGDCMIDVNGFILTFEYAEKTTPTRVTVTQTDASGEQLSEVERHDVRDAPWPPIAQEITGDDRLDVLLPLFTEDGNTTFKVYQPDAEGTLFASGEITATAPDAVRGEDGLTIATTAHGADLSRETAFMSDEWHGFDMVYVMEINASSQSCRIVDQGDLSAVDLSADNIVADCEARAW